ncbi:MAG: glycine--tRNA ligase [Candidatus Parcubacteria bacterium]|nr:glycine--tRNA ligase [Candidatus Parcubacteria bacterium]
MIQNQEIMEKIVSLCKRRGFVYPGSEIYGGLANSWDYGPYGTELKNNIKQAWWKMFVKRRDDMVGIDAALIMNPKVWEASGHLKTFSDPLIECKKCHERYKADMEYDGLTIKTIRLEENKKQGTHDVSYTIYGNCVKCGTPATIDSFTRPTNFNLMLKTFLGSTEDNTSLVYFRPETAQAMFVDFRLVLNSTRQRVPFGIAQIGKAFRNEITPGNYIFRTREFEQMEIEYFIREKNWQKQFDYWLEQMKNWMDSLGLDKEHIHFREIAEDERAHYSKRTIDIDYDFPFGVKELYGLAYRTDFDLKNHQAASGQDMSYTDPATNEKFIPHVIEPTFGVDRSVLAVLCESYAEEKIKDEERVVLRFPKHLAPIKIAIFPLLKNKPELVKRAREIYDDLRVKYMCEFDDNGNIGKRYRRQDEIGTPYCVTVDFDTLENKTATVRDRDTMKQERVATSDLNNFFSDKLSGC